MYNYMYSGCILAIICSNSFSHCKVDQKKTVAISQMISHVQLYVQWLHLLNTRICRYTYITSTVIYCDQDRYVNEVVQHWKRDSCVHVRCISNKIWTHITLFFICSAWLCMEVLKKIIARMFCFMHQGIFRTNYSFNNDVFFYFRAQKIPFDLF